MPSPAASIRYSGQCPLSAANIEPTPFASALTALPFEDWVLPAARRCERQACLARPPGPRFVIVQGGHVPEDRAHDAPRRLDVVLAGEIRGVPLHRLREQPLVSVHRV